MKFKVGDWVERTEESLNSKTTVSILPPQTGVYKIVKVYEGDRIISIGRNGESENWHEHHWQLAKNHIVRQIIQDL